MSKALPSTACFSNTQAVLFDLDGTLLDSAPDLAAAANRMRELRGLHQLDAVSFRPFCGSGARGMLKVAFDLEADAPEYGPMKDEFLDHYAVCLTERTQPFEGVEALLAQLQHSGLPWGVVTNKAERFSAPLTRAFACFSHAAVLVSGDTTPHAKPHPAPLWEAAKRLRISPERCLYVGDDARDIQAGRSAGMRTVAARYGYLGPQAQVAAWGADAQIDQPLDLLTWLPGLWRA